MINFNLIRKSVKSRLLITRRRPFTTQSLRRELIRSMEQEQGVYDLTVWNDQFTNAVLSKATEFLVEDDLFENPDTFKDFLSKVKNNNILLDYVVKYERLVDIDALFIVYERFIDNFQNLQAYKEQAVAEFKRSLEEFKAKGEVEDEAEITFSQKFYRPPEFLEQALYRLFIEKIVLKKIKQSLEATQYLKAMVILNMMADLDPRQPDEKFITLVSSSIKKHKLFAREFVEKHSADVGPIYVWLSKWLAGKPSQELTAMAGVVFPKMVRSLQKNLAGISPLSLIDLLLIMSSFDEKLLEGKTAFLSKVGPHVEPYFDDLSLGKLFDLFAFHRRLHDKKSSLLLITMAIYKKFKSDLIDDRVRFASFMLLFDLEPVGMEREVQVEAIQHFPKLQFIEEDLPFIWLLRFYFQKLIELDLVSQVRLSFVSEYLISIDKDLLDTENFSFVYYHLTLFGYYSQVLARDYSAAIQACLSEKKLIAAKGGPAGPESSNALLGADSSILDLMWAYLVNCRKCHQEANDHKLIETCMALFKTFRKNFKVIECQQPIDIDKIAQVNYILKSWAMPESLEIRISDVGLNDFATTPFEKLLSEAKLVRNVEGRRLQRDESSSSAMFENVLTYDNASYPMLVVDQAYLFKFREADGEVILRPNSLLAFKRELYRQGKQAYLEVNILDLLRHGLDIEAFLNSQAFLSANLPLLQKHQKLYRHLSKRGFSGQGGQPDLDKIFDLLNQIYIERARNLQNVNIEKSLEVCADGQTQLRLASLRGAEDEYPDSGDEDYL